MSYKCELCDAMTAPGEREIKLVTKVRNVIYQNMDKRHPDKTSSGQEIVNEAKICQKCVKRYGEDFEPQQVDSVVREVHMTRPRRNADEELSPWEG